MAGENIEFLLARREHELRTRLAGLRAQMKPLETELAQVQQMRALLPEPDPKRLEDVAKLIASQRSTGQTQAEPRPRVIDKILADEPLSDLAPDVFAFPSPWAGRTIKDLVIQALIDGFPKGGNAPQIRFFIQSEYHREIDAGSLRTQLHRLKQAGILSQTGDTWDFQSGKRSLYMMYDHPTSRAGMSELQDDPAPSEINWNDPLIKQVEALAWKDDPPKSESRPVFPWEKDDGKEE
jgi:hypothetical protein